MEVKRDRCCGDRKRNIHEIHIRSKMDKEQVREALLNWRKVSQVLTYREMWDIAFPEPEKE
jgi:hypothetical protein